MVYPLIFPPDMFSIQQIIIIILLLHSQLITYKAIMDLWQRKPLGLSGFTAIKLIYPQNHSITTKLLMSHTQSFRHIPNIHNHKFTTVTIIIGNFLQQSSIIFTSANNYCSELHNKCEKQVLLISVSPGGNVDSDVIPWLSHQAMYLSMEEGSITSGIIM